VSLHHFSFISPGYLFLLLLLPALLVVLRLLHRRRSRYTVSFTNLELLAGVGRRRGGWRRHIPLTLIALALAMSAAAVAQPAVEANTSRRGATVILLVDVSQSMQAFDITPSRLNAAILAMQEFLKTAPAGDKIGLVTFSDQVEVLEEPTIDHAAIASRLDILRPQGGTAVGDGVETAVKLIVSTLAAEGVHHEPGRYLPAAIVLESDGDQNRGKASPLAAAQLAKAAGVRIYGVALGKKKGYITQGTGFTMLKIPVPPDYGLVALLARVSGGQAFAAKTSFSLDNIYRKLGTSVGKTPKQTQITSWFEIAAVALLLAGVGAARLRGAALP
jgi:Ca-activated chloride channel homolog